MRTIKAWCLAILCMAVGITVVALVPYLLAIAVGAIIFILVKVSTTEVPMKFTHIHKHNGRKGFILDMHPDSFVMQDERGLRYNAPKETFLNNWEPITDEVRERDS